jgi:hypothetical protein
MSRAQRKGELMGFARIAPENVRLPLRPAPPKITIKENSPKKRNIFNLPPVELQATHEFH